MEQSGNYVIAEEAQEKIELALAQGRNWIAYNSNRFFLEKENLNMFSSKGQAISFAALRNEQDEEYHLFYASTMADVFRNLPYGIQSNNISSLQNNTIMNEKNLEYLKDNLKNMGFGDKLNGALEENIRANNSEFQLKADASFNGQQMEAILSFKKGGENEMYFFNNYSAALVKNGEPDLANTQTFFLNRGYGVTFKEAFNLLNDRSVYKELTNKEGEKYKAWIKFDFSQKDNHGNFKRLQFHDNYGYRLENELAKYPIKEMNNESSKEMLLKSLQKGNQHPVTFEKEGKGEKMFIEANPQYKTLNIFGQDLKQLSNEQKNALVQNDSHKHKQENISAGKEENPSGQKKIASQENSESKEETKEKEKSKNNIEQEEKQQNKNSRKVNKPQKEESLLPKKRASNKKGLSI
ncbi:MAG TPA: hypothetical protein VMT76_06850 [Puia sp.]|nr:hypothetical protein [Puia sp.]